MAMALLFVQPRQREASRFIAESQRGAGRGARRASVGAKRSRSRPLWITRILLFGTRLVAIRWRAAACDTAIYLSTSRPTWRSTQKLAAQAFSHPPDLGAVTGLEHRADPGHPRDAGAE